MDVKEPFASRSSESLPSKVRFVPSSHEEKTGEVKVAITGYNGIKIGLNKEELMKYANDPFWVKFRMLSFVLFWLVWWATLAGSTVIIFYTPKCTQMDIDLVPTTSMDNSTSSILPTNFTDAVTNMSTTVTTAINSVVSPAS